MKIDLKNKYTIVLILTVSVLSFMSAIIILNPYAQGPRSNDADKDGIADEDDNCPVVHNSDQSDVDNDGTGDLCDSCTDTDGDGYGNPGFQTNTCPDDNCLSIENSNQSDADHDTIGDACDICPDDPQNDGDDDGVCSAVDNCPAVYNPGQNDSDADGRGDSCELPPLANLTYLPVGPIHGEMIQFWDTTTPGGGILHYWRWNFGDNTTSSEQHPTHSYIFVGIYPVQLIVGDVNGKTSSITKNVTVSVNNPPYEPTITGPSLGIAGVSYTYHFKATDPDGNQIFYSIEWGDTTSLQTLGPYTSGDEAQGNHSWKRPGRYLMTVKSRDTHNAESNFTPFTVRIPLNIYLLDPVFIRFFEQYHQILFFRLLDP